MHVAQQFRIDIALFKVDEIELTAPSVMAHLQSTFGTAALAYLSHLGQHPSH